MNIVRRRCTPSYRFNPHLISEPIGKTKEMILATVMNDVGNGNKDEVKSKHFDGICSIFQEELPVG